MKADGNAQEPPDGLDVWVVYERPRDYPDWYVLRRQRSGADGRMWVDLNCQLATSLEGIRLAVPPGLHRLPRQPGDDLCIVETWM